MRISTISTHGLLKPLQSKSQLLDLAPNQVFMSIYKISYAIIFVIQCLTVDMYLLYKYNFI